jgi:hypothetical protein
MLPLIEVPDALCRHSEGNPLEEADPGTDIRVMDFLSRLSSLPWKQAKYLLRRSMQEQLPMDVLQRPKAPGFDIHKRYAGMAHAEWLEHIQWHPAIAGYVDTTRLPNREELMAGVGTFAFYSVIYLNKWLMGPGAQKPETPARARCTITKVPFGNLAGDEH